MSDLSDAEFKMLVIRMLQELTGYFNSIKKTQAAMKVVLCEIKKNLQGTNSDKKETRTHINGLQQNEERNIKPEQNEETRIQKNEERLRNLQDIKRSNIQITRVPEGEEEEQEIENLFENIMKENFPNLVKEIDIQVQEAQSPKKDAPKEDHTKTHHN